MLHITTTPSKYYALTHRLGMFRIGLVKLIEVFRPIKITSITF